MILLLDNYDSFTWNLAQALSTLGADIDVRRHDAVTLPQIAKLSPEGLVVSPGPGGPAEAGISVKAIRKFAGKVPILGVCLGMQCIAQAWGGRIVRGRPMHGKTSPVTHDATGLYEGIPSPFDAMRYHSLVVEEASLPAELVPTARTPEGELMGLRHRDLAVEGVQFHPESYRTPCGPEILRRWLAAARAHAQAHPVG